MAINPSTYLLEIKIKNCIFNYYDNNDKHVKGV